MTADVALLFSEWDLNKSRYGETDFLPLMKTPGPMLMILALYLLYVLKIGPALMKKREPFALTSVLLLYNGVQVAVSVYLVIKFFSGLMTYGALPRTCYIDDINERKQILHSIWLYLTVKISELLDTVFFVLRKKDNQITFLHLYHHSMVMLGTWILLKYWPYEILFFLGFLNSLVHVFMYGYYGLAALGPNMTKYLFWKKYVTKFQLIQFVCVFIHYIIAVRTSECPSSKRVDIYVVFHCGLFLILFLKFYFRSYLKKSSDHKDVKIKPDKME